MKSIYTLFFSLFLAFTSFSQIWTGANPVWHYEYFNVGMQGVLKIEQTSTATVLGYNCQVLKGTLHSIFQTSPNGQTAHSITNYGTWYCYVSNDTVFYATSDQGPFYVLYDFGAAVSDSWLIATGSSDESCNDSSYVTVASVSSGMINGQSMTDMNLVSEVGNGWGMDGRVLSRFGYAGTDYSANYLFPSARNCDSAIVEYDQFRFLCYEDDDFSYNPSNVNCEYWVTLRLAESENAGLSVYPNPADELLYVEVSDATRVTVSDYSGKQLNIFADKNGDAWSFNIHELSAGTYLLQCETESGKIRRKVVVVE